MKIEVKIIKENKDGSANAEVNFDKDGLETLVQWGLVAMLTKAIDEYKVKPEEAEESSPKWPDYKPKKEVKKVAKKK
jgi:hypothetical protein